MEMTIARSRIPKHRQERRDRARIKNSDVMDSEASYSLIL
jgi:hypothetical protein